jgi:hypothetical protein
MCLCSAAAGVPNVLQIDWIGQKAQIDAAKAAGALAHCMWERCRGGAQGICCQAPAQRRQSPPNAGNHHPTPDQHLS